MYVNISVIVIITTLNYRRLRDTKRDAILTCDQKPRWVRLIGLYSCCSRLWAVLKWLNQSRRRLVCVCVCVWTRGGSRNHTLGGRPSPLQGTGHFEGWYLGIPVVDILNVIRCSDINDAASDHQSTIAATYLAPTGCCKQAQRPVLLLFHTLMIPLSSDQLPHSLI